MTVTIDAAVSVTIGLVVALGVVRGEKQGDPSSKPTVALSGVNLGLACLGLLGMTGMLAYAATKLWAAFRCKLGCSRRRRYAFGWATAEFIVVYLHLVLAVPAYAFEVADPCG